MAYYGTTLEQLDIELLELMGFEVINPNHPHCKNFSMDDFVRWAASCDVLCFRAFLQDGKIGVGVVKEIDGAVKAGKPIFELPTINKERKLSRDETRARMNLKPIKSKLKNIGEIL